MSEHKTIWEAAPGDEVLVDGWQGIVLGHHPDGNHVVVSFRSNGIDKVVKDKQVEIVEAAE
jgi:hypothetical protein